MNEGTIILAYTNDTSIIRNLSDPGLVERLFAAGKEFKAIEEPVISFKVCLGYCKCLRVNLLRLLSGD